MKVKELKEILKGCNDDIDIMVTDANGTNIRVIGGCLALNEGVQLFVDHEFASDWFEGDDGYEIRWINGKKV